MDLEFFAMGPADLPKKPGSVHHQNGARNQLRAETMSPAMLEYGTHFEKSTGFLEQLSGFSVHLPVAKSAVACDHGHLRHWKLQESVSTSKFPWVVLLPNPLHQANYQIRVRVRVYYVYVETC